MWREELCPGVVVLRRFVVWDDTAINAALHGITTKASNGAPSTAYGGTVPCRTAARIAANNLYACDVQWSHWLADTISGATRRVKFERTRRLFPEAYPEELSDELRVPCNKAL
jgi:hypothetical protein